MNPQGQTSVLYQWRTSRGAVAREFFTEGEARAWMKKKTDNPFMVETVRKHFANLSLFRIETTVVETELN